MFTLKHLCITEVLYAGYKGNRLCCMCVQSLLLNNVEYLQKITLKEGNTLNYFNLPFFCCRDTS